MELTDVQVRSFTSADISGFLAYWYDGDPAFLSTLGVNLLKLPRRAKMREMLELNVARDSRGGKEQSALLAIALRGETIGVHEMTHLIARPGDGDRGFETGIMHAHLWTPEHRGQGIAIVSYVHAMRMFFDRFGLDAVLYESPAHNVAANRIKEKLGIQACGEGQIRWPLLAGPTRTVRYRVTLNDMPEIEKRMRSAWRERGHRVETC
jgi:RimJ/RimL family protein N-acetyltransferase